jgi:hypothetical protein
LHHYCYCVEECHETYLLERNGIGKLGNRESRDGIVFGIGTRSHKGHTVADLEVALDLRPNLDDLTRTLASDDEGESLRVETGALIGVDKVDTGIGYFDKDLVGLWSGLGNRHIGENGAVTVLGDLDGMTSRGHGAKVVVDEGEARE